MTNFQIEFSVSPWLLLLLIPALVLTFLPYFRMAKKYRRNRNRIISIILHLVIMLLSVCVLSGMFFSYDVPNTDSELILLVDSSFSGADAQSERDNFVRSVLDSSNSACKVGIVTFGFNQVYAAELGLDADRVYSDYLAAAKPDDSATDIAAALTYTSTLFTNKENAKIVLLTDGVETDGNALTVIRSIAADGIRVDTAHFPTAHADEVLILGVTLPEQNILVGEEFEMTLTVQSSYQGNATVQLFDTDENAGSVPYAFTRGVQNIPIKHTFATPGLHSLRFQVTGEGDTIKQNNDYYTYIDMVVHDRILILESVPGEADTLKGMLDRETDEFNNLYDVDVFEISDIENVPATPEEMCLYDQIILVNIARGDMPDLFEDNLYTYVDKYGGGLLTVGGHERTADGGYVMDANGNPVAHAYDRTDMKDSKFQELLPVQAIDYTPPLGVVIVIDRSGSMASDTSAGMSALELAKAGATECLSVLQERDWVGIMTLEDSYEQLLDMTPMTQKRRAQNAIDSILEANGGTMFRPALERAYMALSLLNSVERKHVILITDGQAADSLDDGTYPYGEVIDYYYSTFGITLSIATIGDEGNEEILAATERGHGTYYPIKAAEVSQLPALMVQELTLPEIKAVVYEPYQPKINRYTSAVSGIRQEDIPVLNGFFGTRAKADAEVALMGEYVPVYAQWKFGKGNVGSFMCDLNGYWSSDFVGGEGREVGFRFVNNVVASLFPVEDIRPKDISVQFLEDNYTTQASVYYSEPVGENETVEVTITSPPAEGSAESVIQTIALDREEAFSRFTFVITRPGIHRVDIVRKDANGAVVSSLTAYKAFSYSEEYNIFVDEEAELVLVSSIAEGGGGKVVTNPSEVWEGFLEGIHKIVDPRLPFMIAAIVLFLLDIAVRKFKFKWIHELVRERRAKRQLTQRET